MVWEVKREDGMEWRAKKRQLQDSNLRGQSPTDFESVSLTTRTNCLGNNATICIHVVCHLSETLKRVCRSTAYRARCNKFHLDNRDIHCSQTMK